MSCDLLQLCSLGLLHSSPNCNTSMETSGGRRSIGGGERGGGLQAGDERCGLGPDMLVPP